MIPIDCNVCARPLGAAIYRANSQHALTSLCELRPGRCEVWACAHCGHLRSAELADAEAYYAADYRILLNHDDEDQIYRMDGETIIYRTEHQVAVMLNKLALPAAARLLDYGCAKAHTPRQLLRQRPDLGLHLFDVSTMYAAHWARFLPAERCASFATPPAWEQQFDVVTSFFSLEHIAQPLAAVRHIAALLKEGGCLYGVVPDTFGNPADFVVVDHVNHFTSASLHYLLRAAGFGRISIDAGAHRGALVFTAYLGGSDYCWPGPAEALSQALQLAIFWRQMDQAIQAAELEAGGQAVAIYGSGFYGAYIAHALQRPELLRCFLDRSPYQQGRQLFGKPILAPAQLPADIRRLYVGLNPLIARATLADMSWPPEQGVTPVFFEP